MTSSSNDYEDQVIRELDVVICDQPGLFLAQFPLKPVYTEPLAVQSARYKPDNRILELTAPIYKPTGNSDNYSDLESQKLISSEVMTANKLAMGFISANTLYLNPIDGVFQMRPSLKQFCDSKTDHIEYSMDMEDEDEEMERESSAAQVNTSTSSMQQIQLKRKESERAQSARLQSYSHLKQKEEAESWRNLKVFPIGSQESDTKFEHITSLGSTERSN
eukprot:gene1829-1999_t